jgi:hypothetical protein
VDGEYLFEVRALGSVDLRIVHVRIAEIFEVKVVRWMTIRFIFFTTFIFTFITFTEAFQITKLFNSQQTIPETLKMSSEQTFIAVKPDGVMRGLVGEIIARFEKRGYLLPIVGMLILDSSLLR